MREIIFDPRDFIRPPYWSCPHCKAENSFGVLSIHEKQYSRRCKICMSTSDYPLPHIQKKIIYVDQFVISNMMKAIDPDWNAKGTKTLAPFWITMFEKLDTLSKLQLVVCPDTMTHYYESVVSPEFMKLKRLYELLSHGLSFYDFQTIERFSMCLYFEEWLKGKVSENLLLDIGEIFRANVHVWQERMIISINFDNKQEMESVLSPINQGYKGSTQKLFDEWKQLKSFDFDNQFEYEIDSYRRMMIGQYQDYLVNLQKLYTNAASADLNKVLNNAAVSMIQCLVKIGTKNSIDEIESLKKVFDFLHSNALKLVAPLKISALMYSVLARRAAVVGQKHAPKGSIVNDIRTISNVLPYCDAIFIDKECAHILSEIPTRIGYDTKIFSAKNLDAFFEYLDKIEEEMTEEHREKVYEVYGKDYIKPFKELYTV